MMVLRHLTGGLTAATLFWGLMGCESPAYRNSSISQPVPRFGVPGAISPVIDSLTLADLERNYPEAHPSETYAMDWPIDEARLTRGYMPNPPRGRAHWGIDLAGPKGTPILAAHGGTVIYVGKAFRGYGKMILVEGARGWATVYAHLNQAFVKQGERILQGEHIGAMGRTGRATGFHLHFEVRHQKGPVDPLLYLPNGRQIASHLQK